MSQKYNNNMPDKNKNTSVIYFICAVVWFLGGAFDVYKGIMKFAIFYFALGVLFVCLGIYYKIKNKDGR